MQDLQRVIVREVTCSRFVLNICSVFGAGDGSLNGLPSPGFELSVDMLAPTWVGGVWEG